MFRTLHEAYTESQMQEANQGPVQRHKLMYGIYEHRTNLVEIIYG